MLSFLILFLIYRTFKETSSEERNNFLESTVISPSVITSTPEVDGNPFQKQLDKQQSTSQREEQQLHSKHPPGYDPFKALLDRQAEQARQSPFQN
jgi:hypothetical protein